MNIDQDGFPGSGGEDGQHFDGGDTAAIVGTMIALSPYALAEGFTWDILVQLQSKLMKDGLPIRHPTQSPHNDPRNFSRDQLIPNQCSMMPTKTMITTQLFNAHRRRWFLTAWNGDPTVFEVWANWIRVFRPWWGRSVLWFCDIESLLGAYDWKYRRKDNVCRNHMLVSIKSFAVMPTWVSRISFRMNDWVDLCARWERHCEATHEYQTAGLFRAAIRHLTM